MKKRTIKPRGVWERLGGQQGSSLIGALFAVTLFAYGGMSLIELSASENTASVNEMQTSQALQVGTGGLEQAKYLLDLGLSPDVVDKPLGFGNYTITTDPANSIVTVESDVGIGRRAQSITADFSKNCVDIDTSNAFTAEANIQGVSLVKTCNQAATVTKIILDWNWSDCVLNSDNPLSECPNAHADHDHGGATVEEIHLNDTSLYDPDSGYGTPTGEAEAAEEIDVTDYDLTSDGTYLFVGTPDSILFSQDHPGNGLYFITVEFADGSQISETFHDQTLFGIIGGGESLGLETDQGTITVGGGNVAEMEVACTSDSVTAVSMDSDDSSEEEDELSVEIDTVIEGSVTSLEAIASVSLIVSVTASGADGEVTIDSTNTLQVKTLMNGEQLPLSSSTTVEACVADYLDTSGTVTLNANQVLVLFELDVDLSSDPDCPSADYQDVAIVITVEPAPEDEEEDDEEEEDSEDDECTDPEKFLICHVPPGNSGNPQTLCVDLNGWLNGHSSGQGIHNDDYTGACNE